MPTFDLLLKDGKIFDGERLNSASMGIKDGKIVFIGDPMGLHGQREIDLCGAWVLPGGIETHTHIREPELTPRSDFQSESVAAAVEHVDSAPPRRACREEVVRRFRLLRRSRRRGAERR